MMGRLNHDQRQLFYSFRLEDAVPDDHLVRAIAGVLDLSWVHAELAPHYPKLGRPSIDPGLVGGDGFAVDASLIVADANKQRSIPGAEWSKELDSQEVSRAAKEYLATLDDAAFGAASSVTPKFVSPSDPAAQWTGAMRGPAFFAYADNYLIDVKFGIIMDVEASRAIRQAEVGAAKAMIERTEDRFEIKPERLAADTAYGSGANLDWLVNEKKEDCTAHPSDRQVKARGWHLQSGRLQIRQGTRRIHLPSRQDPADDGHVGQRW
jgi:hypothetical protein